MILAVNDLVVGANYNQPGQTTIYPDLPAEKMSIWVFTNDVIMQVTESGQTPPAFSNPKDTELKLYKGFQTIEPIVPFTGLRFKCPSGNAVVTFRCYNSQPMRG